jgi:HK97 family phage prohead protease
MPDLYDFSGIATAYDVLCQDGRIIKKGAFDHQTGQVIPMVWRHRHEDIRNVVGHASLGVSSDPSGMRVKAIFNDTDEGKRAKLLVNNEDIKHLSVWANQLDEKTLSVENGTLRREVKKGTIREVSLVLAGKNPGAYIDDVVRHSDDPLDPESFIEVGVIIHTTFSIDLVKVKEEEEDEKKVEDKVTHEDDSTVATIVKSLTPEQERLFNVLLHSAVTGEKTPPTKPNAIDGTGPTVQEVFETLSEEQKNTLYYMAGELSQEENLSQGDTDPMPKKVTHNIFDVGGGEEEDGDQKLSHESISKALMIAKETRAGSLRDVFAAHEIILTHSITDLDNMFPDAQDVKGGGPQFYSRPMEWVEKVLSACKTRPFARIKSQYADITGADARAKGYVTAAQKVEEVIAVLKRVTTPQTIYKLQKLDRDDIIDITDFDVVMWLKGEMRLMLREELARAILISDGRNDTGADAILAANVRPIYNDDAVYTISKIFNDVANEQLLVDFTATETIELIDYIADARKDYRGSGSPTFYCQPEVLAKLLLVRDTDNRRLHPTASSLAEALRVGNIVEIPPMSAMSRAGIVDPPGLPTGTYTIATLGVIINLGDYVIGADKGGQTAFFDDFDLDYNKFTYLYETRVSGALVNPLSAMAIELVTAKTA